MVTSGSNYIQPLRSGMCSHDRQQGENIDYNLTKHDELVFKVQIQFSEQLRQLHLIPLHEGSLLPKDQSNELSVENKRRKDQIDRTSRKYILGAGHFDYCSDPKRPLLV